MDVLPLQAVFGLWLALVGPVAHGEDAQAGEILGDVEDATDDGVGRGAVVEPAAPHLDPAGAQAQVLCLVLHGDGSDGAVLHPAVVLQGIAQYGNGYGGILEELAAHVLGIGELLEVELVVDDNKLPAALALGGGRHEGGTEDQLQIVGINLLLGKLTVGTALLRQVFETCHTLSMINGCKDSDFRPQTAQINMD